MHDETDPLESELSQLRPIVPSPTLRAGVGRRLESLERFPWRLRIFATAAGLAACAATMILMLHQPPATTPRAADPVVLVSSADEAARCSLAALNRAARRSPEALDALLAEESARRERRPPGEAVRAFDGNFSNI